MAFMMIPVSQQCISGLRLTHGGSAGDAGTELLASALTTAGTWPR